MPTITVGIFYFCIYRDIAERTKGDIYIGVSVIIGLSRYKLVASSFKA